VVSDRAPFPAGALGDRDGVTAPVAAELEQFTSASSWTVDQPRCASAERTDKGMIIKA
jgi:hypothetical protein